MLKALPILILLFIPTAKDWRSEDERLLRSMGILYGTAWSA
jgi:hypothetical protein